MHPFRKVSSGGKSSNPSNFPPHLARVLSLDPTQQLYGIMTPNPCRSMDCDYCGWPLPSKLLQMPNVLWQVPQHLVARLAAHPQPPAQAKGKNSWLLLRNVCRATVRLIDSANRTVPLKNWNRMDWKSLFMIQVVGKKCCNSSTHPSIHPSISYHPICILPPGPSCFIPFHIIIPYYPMVLSDHGRVVFFVGPIFCHHFRSS